MTIRLWIYLGIAAFAGAIVWDVGHRGIYLFDQSGVFDGGWRVLQGQVMYRDFRAPYGPVVFWLQALFWQVGRNAAGQLLVNGGAVLH